MLADVIYIYIKLAVAEAALRWGVAFSLFLLHYKTWQATAFTRDSVERLQPAIHRSSHHSCMF